MGRATVGRIGCQVRARIDMIKTKSVRSRIDRRNDGLRILVTRFRGRALRKTRYDIWMANLGPSEKLLRDGQAGKISWGEFSGGYRKELFEGGAIDRKNKTIKNHGQKFTLRLLQQLAKRNTITLLCHCAEEERHCHRHVLRKILNGKV
jgi:uncharacterized protein YeaO (DUF488 family)